MSGKPGLVQVGQREGAVPLRYAAIWLLLMLGLWAVVGVVLYVVVTTIA
ncbi:MAG TPA: hypothetical protein VHS03_11650 [Gaiellaceae bacterium]|jgi:hypothetical protein|nr:hypothetical protein [Gaiellaceae bacterium]